MTSFTLKITDTPDGADLVFKFDPPASAGEAVEHPSHKLGVAMLELLTNGELAVEITTEQTDD